MPFPDQLLIPNQVLRIAEKLEQSGFETWCVGGAIRDTLLGLENKDFDLATAAKPEDVQQLFRRSIPIGIDHGTVAVLDRNKRPHEVTTFRKDVVADGRHAKVEFGVSLDDDLARRDFTINAIAYHPFNREWRDPYDGEGDLERKLIRAVGDPNMRFQEDYLRILRALRFAARFGFAIDPSTWEAAKANVGGLEHLSAERVREEWFRGLEGARRASELVELWKDVGALEVWLPEVRGELFAGADGVPVVDRFREQDPVLITSYLSSDPPAALTRLRCSRAEVERGRAIARHRGVWPEADDPRSVRRWMAAVGSGLGDLLAIASAEGCAGRLSPAVERERRAGVPLAVADLAIDGHDLRELGIPDGPQMGSILRELLSKALDDPSMNDKDRLLATARDLATSTPAHSAQRTPVRRTPRGHGASDT